MINSFNCFFKQTTTLIETFILISLKRKITNFFLFIEVILKKKKKIQGENCKMKTAVIKNKMYWKLIQCFKMCNNFYISK